MKHAISKLRPVTVALLPPKSEIAHGTELELSHIISTKNNGKMRISLCNAASRAGLASSERSGVRLAAFRGSIIRKGSRPRSSDHCVTDQSKFAA